MIILAALLLAAQAQAGPSPDPLTFDLRCMIAASSLRESQDPTVRATVTAAALFFFGRVDARLSEAELERRLTAESATVLTADRGALMRACGAFMSARGQVLVGIGQRMTARGRAAGTR